MAFTEFYCDNSVGSNLNGGRPIGGVYPLTYASGSWVASTGVFTVASGNPSTDGVTVGDFASVYPDGTTPDAVFVGRVTARDATTITVSLTAKSGTAPTDGTNNRTCKVGGAWQGPNAASGFPLNFVVSAMVNSDGDTPRINMRNSSDYQITAGVTMANNGPLRVQGYTSTVGDGGRLTLDGGTNAITILTLSGTTLDLVDAIAVSSATSGANYVVSITGAGAYLHRCVAHGGRQSGFAVGVAATLRECEAYDCNKAAASALGGIYMYAAGAVLIRCISHDNPGIVSSGHGFVTTMACTFIDCIAGSNTGDGFNISATTFVRLLNCEAYNNGRDGVRLANTSAGTFLVESSNLVANVGWGINGSGSGARAGAVATCGFGSGTAANGSGETTGLKSMTEIGSVTYPANVTPWVDPANGDFRIALAQAKGTGRGGFTQTQGGYAGTIGYPDIGAAQHQDAGGAAMPTVISH